MEKEHKIYKISVRGKDYEISLKTIEKNYELTSNYNELAGHLEKPRDSGFTTIQQYIELLKQGKIKYFNLSLGTSLPILIIENPDNMEIVEAFCAKNNITYSNRPNSLMFGNDQDTLNKVRNFCLDNSIAYSTSSIEI